ncbi:hypothetical protein C6503_26590 [Candidatus Poribacteria bacterium]|nr:MAG: hypothetical protein C6503_26590 [Candidatus Poribacteria bacterium]
MRWKFAYIMLRSVMSLACCLLVVDVCGQASDITHVAFTSRRTGNSDIYIMDIDGKNIQNLTNHPAADFSPMFSPNGR